MFVAAVGLRLGSRLEEAFTHAGYLIGARDAFLATSILWIAVYLITRHHENRRP